MDNSVTHVAGPVIKVYNRLIQRCPICGEKLIDNYGFIPKKKSDGTKTKIQTWREGALVRYRTSELVPSLVGDFWDEQQKLPKDFCLALVE